MKNLTILATTAEEALSKAPAGYNFAEECDSGNPEEKAFIVFETSTDRDMWVGQE